MNRSEPSILFMVIVVSAVVLTACTATLPRDGITGGRSYFQDMGRDVHGFHRSYRVHIPPSYTGKTPLPLVVVVHGAFDTAAGMEKFSGYSRLADRERFIVLYPNGIGILGWLQHWNAGHCCGKAAADGIDDVGFVAAAIEDASMRLAVDRQRIYMTGFSNGGMFVHRFAAEKGAMLAAAAPVAASMGGRASADAPEWRLPPAQVPMPVLLMHGADDHDIPMAGGRSPRRGGDRSYLSLGDAMDYWTHQNGCQNEPRVTHMRGNSVTRMSWQDCRTGKPVVCYILSDWGHLWPGPYFTAALPDAEPLKGFDAAEVIWNFFASFSR